MAGLPSRLHVRGETFVTRIVTMAVPAAALTPSPPVTSWLRLHVGITVRGEAALGATGAAGRRLDPVLPCWARAVARLTTIITARIQATAHAIIIREGLITTASSAIKDVAATQKVGPPRSEAA
jgi:hypothetical protein